MLDVVVAVVVAVTVALGVAVTVAPGVDVVVTVTVGVGVASLARTLAIESLDAAGTAIEPDVNATWRPGRSAPPCLR